MWQRFTERARGVIFYAQEEAQKFGEGCVSTEHILLGLVRENDSTAAAVFDRLGVSLHRVQTEVEKQLPRGEPRVGVDMTLTPRAKRVIDLAYDEARSLNNNFIGTEHLLLGLIREGEGLAGRVLAKLAVDLDRARAEIIAIQEADTERPAAPTHTISRVPGITEMMRSIRAKVQADGARRGMLFVGTHDYLWAFLENESSAARRALDKSGARLEELTTEIAGMRKLEPIPGAHANDDPIAAAAHAEAERIAKAMGSHQVNTGHFLLAMMVLSWSSVYLMMSNQGVAYEHLWLLVAHEGDEV